MPKSNLQKRKYRSQESTPLEGAWGNQTATKTARSGLVIKPKKEQPGEAPPAAAARQKKPTLVPSPGDSSSAASAADDTTCWDHLQSAPELSSLLSSGRPSSVSQLTYLVSGWSGIPGASESYRARTPSSPMSDIIGAQQHPSVCLILLLRHYPWIVYMGYSFWRKLLVMLPWGTEPSAHPPLAVPTRKLRTQHLGACGNLKASDPGTLFSQVKSRRDVLASVFASSRQRDCLSLLMKLEDENKVTTGNDASPSRFFINWQDLLLVTIRRGDAELCRSLLESNRTSSSPSGGEPMAAAIQGRNPELVQLLLDFQAPVDKAVRNFDEYGTWWRHTAPRQLAYENRDIECLKVLYAGGAKKMTLRDIMSPMSIDAYLTLRPSHRQFLLEVAELGADGTTDEGEYATTHLKLCLLKVASHGHNEKPLEVVGMTVEESVARHITKKGQQAAHEVILLELAEILVVKFGANVGAFQTRNRAVVRFLLKHSPETN